MDEIAQRLAEQAAAREPETTRLVGRMFVKATGLLLAMLPVALWDLVQLACFVPQRGPRSDSLSQHQGSWRGGAWRRRMAWRLVV